MINISTKTQSLFRTAFDNIVEAINNGYYSNEDLELVNFSEICEWCNFPDMQDCGLYEQIIMAAIETIKKLDNITINNADYEF